MIYYFYQVISFENFILCTVILFDFFLVALIFENLNSLIVANIIACSLIIELEDPIKFRPRYNEIRIINFENNIVLLFNYDFKSFISTNNYC